MLKLVNLPYKSSSTSVNRSRLAQNLNALLSRQDLGYLDLVKRKNLWDSSDELGQKIRSEFENIVIIGFGGSSMSARALVEITHTQNISFLDNVDIDENIRTLSDIKLTLDKTAWIFISKSGNTIEVLALINFLSQYLEEKNICLWKNSFYITEQKSNPLFNLAQKHERPCLELPVDVGGRFSFLSPCGMLIASLCGLNIELIKQGATLALQDKEAILKISEQYLSSFEDRKSISLFWFYNSSMRWFGGWLQQLWAESLGKKMNRQNTEAYPFSTPMIAIGSSDQHSILQQVMDGEKNKFITFFRFNHIEKYNYIIKKSYFDETTSLLNKNFGTLIEAQAQGTAEALQENGIPQITIEIEKLDEKNLGYLFMYFQLVVSLLGEYHDINAFDQPGVQAGKIKTLDKLNN